jgi:hypothetical protein
MQKEKVTDRAGRSDRFLIWVAATQNFSRFGPRMSFVSNQIAIRGVHGRLFLGLLDRSPVKNLRRLKSFVVLT